MVRLACQVIDNNDMKRLLRTRGVDTSTIVEKEELVGRVRELIRL